MNYLLLVLSFVLLLAGAVAFTNAVEWAGHKLGLGAGAVGSILAAVATALPESVIPIVAIISGEQTGQIAIGAIIGAPFLLGTLAMFLVGISVIGFSGRRAQGRELRLHRATTTRDLVVFLVALPVVLLLGVVGNRVLNIVAAVLLVAGYVFYVWRSLRSGGESEEKENLKSLYFDPSKDDPPAAWQTVVQMIVGLAAIVGGANLFVSVVEHLATQLGVSALILALVLAPLATELPEKTNSVIWTRAGKDSLAVGNITGAMVFQSMIPVAVGLAFTPWQLGPHALAAGLCGLAGALLTLWAVRRHKRFHVPALVGWGLLYVGFVVTAILTR